ncbi:M14 family zinc carboxypeptidase [Halovivax gelatinilyticus]|uniref:M14 family zinc carboxypeptidase n=1 Tax=Halovivax gelatinilyticus TaxID=2961597 RepID=UPI0020CA343A|nr:M14 family zinc carboxypeptidase [Halovivax gelatinilyticus]
MSSFDPYPDGDESRDEPDRYTYEEAATLDEEAFDETIDRRTFMGVAAATGAALSLPSAVSADVIDEAVTDLASFVVSATPDSYAATLVLEFEDAAALDVFADEYAEPDWDPDESLRAAKAVTREEPTPAAHATLTEDELADALDVGGVELVDFSPGANPFWKLEDPYADGVFPDVVESRDWVAHAEVGQALDHLEAEYPDRVRVHRIGEGPGWENVFTGADPDPRDIYVAELTNDIQDEAAFEEKEKAIFIVGIHGNERAGVEAGSRILEAAAKGESDEFNPLLDDVVISFVYINPDGWVIRKPQFFSPNQLSHYRGNASLVDTNRQYPTIGWADPSFYPGEPVDAPDEYWDIVPDSLATVGFLRGYDNVEYVCDYHMMGWANSMVLNLESNAAYDHDGTHNLDEVNRRIGAGMDDEWGTVEAIADDTIRAGQDTAGIGEYVPDEFFNWGTIYDSIGYNVTGALLGWAGQPEEDGGLGAVTVAPELGMRDATNWRPYIERHLATAYHISMREFAELCAAETEATVVTGGQDTAYVTTDDLTRTSADLSHTDEGPGRGTGRGRAAEVHRRHETVQPGPAGSATATTAGRTHSLAVQVHTHDVGGGVVTVRGPRGEVVREIDIATLGPDACCLTDLTTVYVPNPDAGAYTVDFEPTGGVGAASADAEVELDVVTIDTEEDHPDPEEIMGFSQREYVVNPMQFFEDLEPFLDEGWLRGLSVHHVKIGRLMRGNSGKRHFDNVVVSTDVAADDPAFVDALETFLDAGGRVLLTDAGVNLLGSLEIGGASEIGKGDVSAIETDIANLEDRDFDHHLLTDIRELQLEMWKGSQVGYTTGVDSPGTVVDDDAFEAAGGEIAGRMYAGSSWSPGESGVAAGTIPAGDGEIEVLGSVLPVANQRELHPFGMADYALSFMGHTLICNALGFEQHRYVDGELVGVWGELR